jgi:hypothetical protein
MPIHSEQIPFVVVKYPSYHREADFASRWLAAAVEADRIVAYLFSTNPEFESRIERLALINHVEFSAPAMAFICRWQEGRPAFALDLFASEWYEPFAYMVGIGFFTWSDQHCYQLTEPPALTSETIAQTLLQLAPSEEENDYLNLQSALTTMTEEDANRSVLVIEHRELARSTTPFKETAH